MPLSPQQIADKQIKRTTDAVEDYRTGVANPRRNAIEAAIAAEPKWKARMQEAITKGTWGNSMRNTPKDSAAAKAVSVGADRLAQGVQASADKIARFHNNFAPGRNALQRTVEGLPELTEADRDARALANIKGMRALKGTWRK